MVVTVPSRSDAATMALIHHCMDKRICGEWISHQAYQSDW
jgi:hypothetical protein